MSQTKKENWPLPSDPTNRGPHPTDETEGKFIEIIHLIAKGEDEGFLRLWRSRFGKFMIRKCLQVDRITENSLRSTHWKELLQDCNERIYRTLKNIKIEEDIKHPKACLGKIITWVCQSAIDKVFIGKDENKQSLVKQAYCEAENEEDEITHESKELKSKKVELGSSSTKESGVRLDLDNLIKRARLSSKDHKLLNNYLENREFKDIAMEDRVSIKAIKQRFNRIVVKLRLVNKKII